MIGVATPPDCSCDSHSVLPLAGSSAKSLPAELPAKIKPPAVDNAPPLDWKQIFEQYRDYGRRLQPYVDDVGYLLMQSVKAGKRVLFEGAHAVLLDVDHGTYPFVTSSNCSALGLFTALLPDTDGPQRQKSAAMSEVVLEMGSDEQPA